MNTEELKEELPHKERKIKDLIEFIKNRSDKENPNYSMFLGSGASFTSGIRTGNQLMREWRREIYKALSNNEDYEDNLARDFLIKNHGHWYNPLNEYSSLFEKKFDLPSQRRRFVESEVDGRLPSIGYSYLVSLVNRNYLNTIFTTNFDDLINEAFYQFSAERPFMCAHDSSIKDLSIRSSRPKIIKLHGDYLFDDIKSTLRETESLENNTKDKLLEFSKELGIIFIGYSGSDRSVMDVVNYMLRSDEYLKNGIYWCIKKGDQINNDLRKLLWKERVYYVEIDGFDETLAEVHHEIIGKLELKEKSTSKKEQIFDLFSKDEFRLSHNSKYIMMDTESLRRHQSSMDISNLIRELAEKDGTFAQEKLSEGDFKNLLNIDNLIKSEKYDLAIHNTNLSINSCQDDKIKSKYKNKLISIYIKKNEYTKAIKEIDTIIEDDVNDIRPFITKSYLYKSLRDRYNYILENQEKFTHEYQFHNLLARTAISFYNSQYQPENTAEIRKIISNSISKSIKLEPSLSNPAWLLKIDEINLTHPIEPGHKTNKEEREKLFDEILKDTKSINEKSTSYIKLLKCISLIRSDYKKCLESLRYIESIYATSNKNKKSELISYYTEIITRLNDCPDNNGYKDEFRNFIYGNSDLGDIDKNTVDYKYASMIYTASIERNIDSANLICEELIYLDKNAEYITDVVKYCSSVNAVELADKLLDHISEVSDEISDQSIAMLRMEVHQLKGQTNEALMQIDRYLEEGGSYTNYIEKKSYLLLVAEQFEAAYTLISENLKSISSHSDRNTLIINRECAAKNLGRKVDEVALRNVVATGSKEHAMCALSLLGHESQAMSKINDLIENDFLNLHTFNRWPAVDKRLLDNVFAKGKYAKPDNIKPIKAI